MRLILALNLALFYQYLNLYFRIPLACFKAHHFDLDLFYMMISILIYLSSSPPAYPDILRMERLNRYLFTFSARRVWVCPRRLLHRRQHTRFLGASRDDHFLSSPFRQVHRNHPSRYLLQHSAFMPAIEDTLCGCALTTWWHHFRCVLTTWWNHQWRHIRVGIEMHVIVIANS